MIMHWADPGSCFLSGETMEQPRLGSSLARGVSAQQHVIPQHSGTGWIQPPRTHQLLVAQYKVVHGHPGGGHLWGQGSTPCGPLQSQCPATSRIHFNSMWRWGWEIPSAFGAAQGWRFVCVFMCVLKSLGYGVMHGQQQAN